MSQTTAIHGEKISLLRVLGPAHVWALGVGIVLVGEYMGWNFAVGKGGAIARADRLLGRGPALHLRRDDRLRGDLDGRRGRRPVRAGQAHRRPADGLQCRPVPRLRLYDARGRATPSRSAIWCRPSARWQAPHDVALTSRSSFCPSCSWPGSTIAACCDADREPRDHGGRIPRHHHPVRRREALVRMSPAAPSRAAERPALWLARRHRRAAFRPLVLSRHRGHLPGGRGGPLAGRVAAARHDDRHHHAAHRRDDDLVRLRCGLMPWEYLGQASSRRCSTRRA